MTLNDSLIIIEEPADRQSFISKLNSIIGSKYKIILLKISI